MLNYQEKLAHASFWSCSIPGGATELGSKMVATRSRNVHWQTRALAGFDPQWPILKSTVARFQILLQANRIRVLCLLYSGEPPKRAESPPILPPSRARLFH
jgi:hypothetical protein